MDPQADAALWHAAVAKVLKGRDFATLAGRSRDGIPIEPLYPKSEPAGPAPWHAEGRPFGVMQRIDHPDLEAANAQARADVAGGCTGLVLVGAGAPTARGFGLPFRGPADVETLLAGIDLATVALHLEAPANRSLAIAEHLLAWGERQGLSPDLMTIDVGLDAADGAATHSLHARGLACPLLRADGRAHHAAGASEAQELAAVLSAGVAGLRALEPLGLDAVAPALSFTLAADTDLVLTVGKLRALRRLWARIEGACALASRPLALHVETAWRSLALVDPHTNILRGAIAAVGAILGGADSLTVLPFTSALGLPDDEARRLARNTTLILLEEAGLGRVADAGGGSGAIETMTDALCQEAWRLFQGLEQGGGLAAAMAAGTWQATLARTAAARQADLAAGRAILVGVTAFPPPEGPAPTVLAPAPPEDADAHPLPARREAAAFEVAP